MKSDYFIVSHYILDAEELQITDDVIVRINVAWLRNEQELERIVSNEFRRIYLDYPTGRTKPPQPEISLERTIQLANKYVDKVHFFAYSNAENKEIASSIRKQLNPTIKLVPKIETLKGIIMFKDIVKASNTNLVMLDKEDLYIDTQRNTTMFHIALHSIRARGKELGVTILELHGVIFRG